MALQTGKRTVQRQRAIKEEEGRAAEKEHEGRRQSPYREAYLRHFQIRVYKQGVRQALTEWSYKEKGAKSEAFHYEMCVGTSKGI